MNLRYIYQDNTGYGVLTGARGDNTDRGTCLNTLCHGNSPNPPLWGSPSTLRCGYCHNPANSYGAIPTPPAVNDNGSLGPVSPHVSARKGSTFADRGRDCHSGRSGGVGVPLPPSGWNNNGGAGLDMASILGFTGYSVSGRINLGGPRTDCTISGNTTEAEICWGCHDHAANAVTEWGYNTKTTPAGSPVSYASFPTQNDGTSERANAGYTGTDNAKTARTSDWTAGLWVNQYDNLIRRRVVSVHSANFDFSGQSSSVASNVNAGGLVNRASPVLENRSYIRCSYCHDVHDLNRAQNDNSSGTPFLRGAWVGDPYPPELPPRASNPYTTRINTFGYPTPNR